MMVDPSEMPDSLKRLLGMMKPETEIGDKLVDLSPSEIVDKELLDSRINALNLAHDELENQRRELGLAQDRWWNKVRKCHFKELQKAEGLEYDGGSIYELHIVKSHKS